MNEKIAPEQKVFNEACEHLARQKRRSIDGEEICRYRSKDGTRCVVGHFISDEEYVPEMEGRIVEDLGRMNGWEPPCDARLLQELQNAHDSNSTDVDLRYDIRVIADNWDLDPSHIDLIKEWR